MNHLNFFNPFVHLPIGYENPLTRAFLVLLRYEPLAQALFLDLVGRRLSNAGLSSPSLFVMSQDMEPYTQQRNLMKYTNGTVVSVLITDAYVDNLPEVRWSDRSAVYDGVLNFGDWTFLIENKPRHGDVRTNQLNPGRSSFPEDNELELMPYPVCLLWPEIFLGLIELRSRELITAVGARLLDDFLRMIDENYPYLAPYKTFALCSDDDDRLNRRCVMILESIASMVGVEVRARQGRPLHLTIEGGAVQEIHLTARRAAPESPEWRIEMAMWPGDTVSQARIFFQEVDREAFLGLAKTGWHIKPNLHFSFVSTHLVWAEMAIEPEAYFDLWSSGKVRPGQVGAEGMEYRAVCADLKALGLIGERDQIELDNHFRDTSRSTMNVIPGFIVTRTWDKVDALRLDSSGAFEHECLERINQALSTWGQKLDVQAGSWSGESLLHLKDVR